MIIASLSENKEIDKRISITPDLVKNGANVIIPYRWVQDLDDVVILRYFPDKIDFTENSEKTDFEFEDDDGFYDD